MEFFVGLSHRIALSGIILFSIFSLMLIGIVSTASSTLLDLTSDNNGTNG